MQSKYCMKIQIPIYFDTCSNYGSNQGYTMQPTGITEHWRRKENKFHEEMNKEKQTHFMSKGKQTKPRIILLCFYMPLFLENIKKWV